MGRLLADEILQNSRALTLAYSLSWMGSRELALAEEILQNSRALTLFYSLCRAWALVKGLSQKRYRKRHFARELSQKCTCQIFGVINPPSPPQNGSR